MVWEADDATRAKVGSIASNMERDLRKLIIIHLGGQLASQDILSEDVWQNAIDRIVDEQGYVEDQPSLQFILQFVDLPDLFHTLNTHRALLPRPLAAHIRTHTPLLERAVPIRNRWAHTRRLLPDDMANIRAIASMLVGEHDIFWDGLKRTLARLKAEDRAAREPSALEGMVSARGVHHNLPLKDFDETGLIGRAREVDDIKTGCLARPYPVVTIFGEGGVGKSALALKVAYEILDVADQPFEAIVWTSAKVKLLTVSEIRRIKGAIETSLGLLQSAVDFLAPEGVGNTLEEIYNYLTTFKILLILDNLETVVDHHIHDFLANLPNTQSKVLITSRIRIGGYEYPYPLRPLDPNDAVLLLRQLATFHQVAVLTRTPNEQLAVYCKRMGDNPGYIKWFVSAVQSGMRPEAALEQEGDLFLDFCMSNVYEYLKGKSRQVLASTLVISGQVTQAELAYYNDMEAEELETVIRDLLTTPMLTVLGPSKGAPYETRYELSDMAVGYLSKFYPVSSDDERVFRKRREQLATEIEQMRTQSSDPYAVAYIYRRSPHDEIIAAYLREALRDIRGKNLDRADDLVRRALRLAPGYFEVHRVEARLRVTQNNITAARHAYETAIELNQNYAPLRLFYAGFLLKVRDLDGAREQLRLARKIDPNAIPLNLEYARVAMFQGDFDESRTLLDKLSIQVSKMSAQVKRKFYDIHLQWYLRQANRAIAGNDKLGALEFLAELRHAVAACPSEVVDAHIQDTLREAAENTRKCARVITDAQRRGQAEVLAAWLEEKAGAGNVAYVRVNRGQVSKVSLGDELSGTVASLPANVLFGFIATDDAQEFFFHRDHMRNPGEWPRLNVGDRVRFTIGEDRKKRRCATEVTRL